MIDINTWPRSIAIAFGLTPFMMGLLGLALSYYIACSRHFHIMIAALPNSAWPREQIIKTGMIVLTSRLNLVIGVGSFLLFPQFNVRRGVLDADDVRNFPPYLQRWLVVSVWLVLVAFTWLMAGYGLLELSKG